VSGLIPEMLQAGYFQPSEYKNEIDRILLKNSGDHQIFERIKNDENKSGDYWWFQEPSKYISYPNLPLNKRVEETVLSLLRKKISVKYDDILAEIFKNFPNGLTPDPRSVVNILQQFAYKSSDRWKISEETERNITLHTMIISLIAYLGKKVDKKVFIGRREQPDVLEDRQRLSGICDYTNLSFLTPQFEGNRIERIEMIDCVWINSDQSISAIFEVENSTDFTSAIQRGSNLTIDIPKYMIVPENREQELLKIADPYFVEGFRVNNWKYLLFRDIIQLSKYSRFRVSDINKISKSINGYN
jgi:hypothetical protein